MSLSPHELQDLSPPALAAAVLDGRASRVDVDAELARRQRALGPQPPPAPLLLRPPAPRPRALDARQLAAGEREDDE